MRTKGSVTVSQLVAMLKRSDFDLQLAADAAESLNLSGYVLSRIAGARREAGCALRAVEAIKAQRKKAA